MKQSTLLLLMAVFFQSTLTNASVTPLVEVLSERHRTDWNWVEYRLTMKNTSESAIENPEIQYYGENSFIQYCERNAQDPLCASVQDGVFPQDAMYEAKVDYSSDLNPVNVSIESVSELTVVRLKFSGALESGKKVNVNFRMYRKDWSQRDFSRDWSYQKNANTLEPNYFIAAYDGNHDIIWGKNPLNAESKSDVALWSDRNGNTVVEPFGGDASVVQKAGRFWMLKTVPLNKKEKSLLEQRGVVALSASDYGDRDLILFKSNTDVKKASLDSLVYGYYNSFNVDDSTKIKIKYESGDWLKKRRVCDASNVCHEEMYVPSAIDVKVACWDDVPGSDCKAIVDACGGENSAIDDHVVRSRNSRAVNECLASNKNVKSIEVERQGEPLNDLGRQLVNVETLQLDNWNIDFTGVSNDEYLDAALRNQRYTGEGIEVGVYDTGIYYDHAGMREYNEAKGEWVPRTNYSLNGQCLNGKCDTEPGDGFHATHVAGIIGGNGNGSDNYMYRGIAPKVKFYSKRMNFADQRGHVVNHSHTYGNTYSGDIDVKTHVNWVDKDDGVPKTVVWAAGNYAHDGYIEHETGEKDPCRYGKGYHSLSIDSKNAVVVGNYVSRGGVHNIHSSMGPTWDGRIKPDVMAPGSGLLGSFGESNPMLVYVDYIKVNNTVLLNFDNNPLLTYGIDDPIEEITSGCKFSEKEKEKNVNLCKSVREPAGSLENSSVYYVDDNKASNKRAIVLMHKDPLAGETYVNWDYRAFRNTPFTIKKGDKITIRMRLSDNLRESVSMLHGSLYLAGGDDFYQKSVMHKHVDFKWNLGGIDGNYHETVFEWDEDDIDSKFLRIDFDHDYGIFSSAPCEDGSGATCYRDASGTSMAAPYVSGVVALMNQEYMSKLGDKSKSLRNSTSKAILIHTADDMVDNVGFVRSTSRDVFAVENKDVENKVNYRVKYGAGPDFVTGWGKVNAKKALEMFDSYNLSKRGFDQFLEFEAKNDVERRWTMSVKNAVGHLRTTLVWDDVASSSTNKYEKKLYNDLDMYLISPSGKRYFPWKLDPLPVKDMNEKGEVTSGCTDGLEQITEKQASKPAYTCPENSSASNPDCFDHLNNVEVVDVDNPEQGLWIVVVKGMSRNNFKDDDDPAFSQVASLVSDFELNDAPENVGCDIAHPYKPQSILRCDYDLGYNMTGYISFSPLTNVGDGDVIRILGTDDYFGQHFETIGEYTGSELAGKRLELTSKRVRVELESDRDASVGYGFKVDKIEVIPYVMFFGVSN